MTQESAMLDGEIQDIIDEVRFEDLVPAIPLPRLPPDPARARFYGTLYTKSTGRRVWRLARGVWWVGPDGMLRCYPPGFSCDLRSSPWPIWSLAPPSIGDADRCWLGHDGDRRGYALMGLRPRDVDLIEFRAMMRASGKGRRRAGAHARSVWWAWRMGFARHDGVGWYGTAPDPCGKYDTQCYDHEDERWKPYAVYLADHYRGDGSSWTTIADRRAA